MKTSFFRSLLGVTLGAALLSLLWPGADGVFFTSVRAEEPSWREPWQKQLIAWMKSLTRADVEIPPRDFDFSQLDPKEAHRNQHLANGGHPPLLVATEVLKMPPENFLWKGIWHDDAEPQDVLRPYGIKQGQMGIPSGPTTADALAWLYSWQRPWNPFYECRPVAFRAAIISMIDLIMIRDHTRFYTSGEKGCRQPPFSPRACESGFSLTFNAFAFLKVASALPPEARAAWADGLRWYAEKNAEWPPGGPENMRLSAPVGIYYAGLGLQDESLKEKALAAMENLLSKNFSKAGYIRDAGVPDGSYNGISLHRLAEFEAITHSPRIKEVLQQAYKLKQALTLPEPDGSTLSPSHFNARCPDGFDFDQYQGREVLFLGDVPAAGFYLRKKWNAPDTQEQGKMLARALQKKFPRIAPPGPWAFNHRWEGVLSLPYVVYHEPDEQVMDSIIAENQEPVIAKKERFTENLGHEFYVIRRPAYAAIFYAGPAVASDNGATNHAAMLNREGGYLMGFGGGGLSAFWTPDSSTLLLGRLTSYEGYDRKIKSLKWGDYIVSGWRDWLSNHVVGKTTGGKILSTTRVEAPRSRWNEEEGGSVLEIRGEMPGSLARQGEITPARVAYHRTYTFSDEGIDCDLEIQTDQPVSLQSLYEVLPVLTGQKNNRKSEEPVGRTTWEFLDAEGHPLKPHPVAPPDGGKFAFEESNHNPETGREEITARVEGVKTLSLSRYKGGASVIFEKPVDFSLSSVEVRSSQHTYAMGRTFLVELPLPLDPAHPIRLRYRIIPNISKQRTAQSLTLNNLNTLAKP